MSCCLRPCCTYCPRCCRDPCCCICIQCPEPVPCFNVSLCNILALLALWSLFDLFCCYFLCDEICWIASPLLLTALIGLGVLYLYRVALRALELLTDLHNFKLAVESKLNCIESKVCSMFQSCECIRIEHNCDGQDITNLTEEGGCRSRGGVDPSQPSVHVEYGNLPSKPCCKRC
ncbi:hypothetical protein M8J75_007384 [Diaphorina citri]|nr:hypothetical protein M8J75_007384 [Diaphorina citri]KAI5748332.1 hypothetical protein M8J77_024450 [Diaphorina citri]